MKFKKIKNIHKHISRMMLMIIMSTFLFQNLSYGDISLLAGNKHKVTFYILKEDGSFASDDIAISSDATVSDATISDATVSDATISDATISDATSSDATLDEDGDVLDGIVSDATVSDDILASDSDASEDYIDYQDDNLYQKVTIYIEDGQCIGDENIPDVILSDSTSRLDCYRTITATASSATIPEDGGERDYLGMLMTLGIESDYSYSHLDTESLAQTVVTSDMEFEAHIITKEDDEKIVDYLQRLIDCYPDLKKENIKIETLYDYMIYTGRLEDRRNMMSIYEEKGGDISDIDDTNLTNSENYLRTRFRRLTLSLAAYTNTTTGQTFEKGSVGGDTSQSSDGSVIKNGDFSSYTLADKYLTNIDSTGYAYIYGAESYNGNTDMVLSGWNTHPHYKFTQSTAADHEVKFCFVGKSTMPATDYNGTSDSSTAQRIIGLYGNSTLMRLYQTVTTTPGDTIKWSFYAAAYSVKDATTSRSVFYIRDGNIGQGTAPTEAERICDANVGLDGNGTVGSNSASNTSVESKTKDTVWAKFSGEYTVPSGQTTTEFGFYAYSQNSLISGVSITNESSASSIVMKRQSYKYNNAGTQTGIDRGAVREGDCITYGTQIDNTGTADANNLKYVAEVGDNLEPVAFRIINGISSITPIKLTEDQYTFEDGKLTIDLDALGITELPIHGTTEPYILIQEVYKVKEGSAGSLIQTQGNLYYKDEGNESSAPTEGNKASSFTWDTFTKWQYIKDYFAGPGESAWTASGLDTSLYTSITDVDTFCTFAQKVQAYETESGVTLMPETMYANQTECIKSTEIAGTAWIDADEDGNIGSSETKLANITVRLRAKAAITYYIVGSSLSKAAVSIASGDIGKDYFGNELTTTTDADGNYTFTNVPAGSYDVEFVLESAANDAIYKVSSSSSKVGAQSYTNSYYQLDDYVAFTGDVLDETVTALGSTYDNKVTQSSSSSLATATVTVTDPQDETSTASMSLLKEVDGSTITGGTSGNTYALYGTSFTNISAGVISDDYDVSLTKRVGGSYGSRSSKWTFTITATDPLVATATALTRDISYEITRSDSTQETGTLTLSATAAGSSRTGSTSIELAHGDTIKLKDVYVHTDIQITETGDNISPTTTTWTYTQGTTSVASTAISDLTADTVIKVVNTRADIVPTGVDAGDVMPLAGLLTILSLLGLCWYAWKKGLKEI